MSNDESDRMDEGTEQIAEPDTIVRAAQRKRLRMTGVDGVDELSEYELDKTGAKWLHRRCVPNAIALAREFRKAGYREAQIRLVPGYVAPRGIAPSTFSPSFRELFDWANDNRIVHFWVEVATKTPARSTVRGEVGGRPFPPGADSYLVEVSGETPKTVDSEIIPEPVRAVTEADGGSSGGSIIAGDLPSPYTRINSGYTLSDIGSGECPIDRVVEYYALHEVRDRFLEAFGIDEDAGEILGNHTRETTAELLSVLEQAWTGTNVEGHERKRAYVQYGSPFSAFGPGESTAWIQTVEDVEEFDVEHWWVEVNYDYSVDDPIDHSREESWGYRLPDGDRLEKSTLDVAWPIGKTSEHTNPRVYPGGLHRAVENARYTLNDIQNNPEWPRI